MEPSFLTPPLPRAWAAPGSARGMLRSSEGGSWGPGRPAWARLVSGILPLPCFDNEVPSQLQPVSSLSPHPTASAVIDTPSHRTKRSTLLLPHCCCGQQNSLGNSQTVTKLCLASEELEGSFLSLVRHHCTSQPGLPERERTGHGSAWYSASKDEVHLLCPAPPSPCTPPHPHHPPPALTITPQMSSRDCGQQLCKQRSLDPRFSLSSAEAAQSSWAQAGGLVSLRSRQR